MSTTTPQRWSHYCYTDFANDGVGNVGAGQGSVDERDDVVLFDAEDKPLVTQRYLRKVGYTPWKQQ